MSAEPDPVYKVPLPEVYEAPVVREVDDDTSAEPYSIGPF